MKKLFLMFTAIASLSLTSCGGNKQANEQTEEATAPQTEAVEAAAEEATAPQTEAVEAAAEEAEQTVKEAAVEVQEAAEAVTEETEKVMEKEEVTPTKIEAGVKAAASDMKKVELKK